METGKLKIVQLSSLAKVFADEAPTEFMQNKGSMLCNEVYSYQLAYNWSGLLKKNVKIHIKSQLLPWITVRAVGLIPSEMPCYGDHDENILRTTPGLYPDSLLPISDEGITLLPSQWRSLWVTIDPAGQANADIHKIEISFCEDTGEELGSIQFSMNLLNDSLPKQKLIHTEWFHADCLSTYYGVEVFSEEHWRLIESFIRTAVEHGINMILTPLFTPPLDTSIGGERPTTQLVDVEISDNTYRFNFDKLKRWVDLCRSIGVEYFEFSHFFTQWGAKHAPKVMALENGTLKRIFGWETDSGGEEYKLFLSRFLPELINFVKQNNLKKAIFFHVSDEPHMEHLESYINASSIISEYVKDYPVIDALSDYKIYETGAVKTPIPGLDHINPFLEHKVPNLWTYYCCVQYKEVANRFFNMPSSRNRILGMQLYKFNIVGFLHWGYNFWNSQLSRYTIDPFKVTDAGYAFPSGDAFLVYPGTDGPIESLRLEVFYEALQDLRALELLESYIGRDAVIALIESGLEHPITFTEYPKNAEWLISKREEINKKIAEYSLHNLK